MNGIPPENPTDGDRPADATLLLERLQAGDRSAADALLPVVYERLRQMAGGLFRSERSEHTLQPTALVHEAYVKLIQRSDKEWLGHDHFCAVASIAMRQILTDYARAKKAAKRDPGGKQVPLTGIAMPSSEGTVDAVALDDCLSELAEFDERGARIVEFRFFGGLTNEQVASVLGLSRATVIREWRASRAWLKTRLLELGNEH